MVLLTGCLATAPVQKLNPAIYYKNDICFSYEKPNSEKKGFIRTFFRNGRDRSARVETENRIIFCGVGVLPYEETYKIKIDSFAEINLFAMTTCHREVTTENPDDGIFKKNGVVNIEYTPTVEKGKACPLYIAAYNKEGRHAWGIVALENPKFNLSAEVSCNGEKYTANGVSICQSREGLLQEINFPEEVKPVKPVNGSADRTENCPELPTTDNKNFKFAMPTRECIYGFIGKTSGKIHKFYSVGYEEFVVRE